MADINPFQSPTLAVEPVPSPFPHANAAELGEVARGLRLVYLSLLILILLAVGGALYGVFMAGARRAAPPADLGQFRWLGLIIGAVMTAIDLRGRFLCLTVPPEANARRLISISLTCAAISFVVGMASQPFLDDGQGFPNAAQGFSLLTVIQVLQSILQIVTYVCFLLFLKRLATFIDRPALANRANLLLWSMPGLVVGFLVTAGLVTAVGPIGMVLVFFCFVAAFVVFVWYVNLINNIRKAILTGADQ